MERKVEGPSALENPKAEAQQLVHRRHDAHPARFPASFSQGLHRRVPAQGAHRADTAQRAPWALPPGGSSPCRIAFRVGPQKAAQVPALEHRLTGGRSTGAVRSPTPGTFGGSTPGLVPAGWPWPLSPALFPPPVAVVRSRGWRPWPRIVWPEAPFPAIPGGVSKL